MRLFSNMQSYGSCILTAVSKFKGHSLSLAVTNSKQLVISQKRYTCGYRTSLTGNDLLHIEQCRC